MRRDLRALAEASLSAAGYRTFGAPGSAEEDWNAFAYWLVVAVASCAVIMATARVVLPLVAPVQWSAMVSAKPAHAIGVPKNVTEWFPALVVPILVWRDVMDLTAAAAQAPSEVLHLLPPPGLWRGCGAALGYMLFDCGVMLVWRRELRESVGAAMLGQLWFHHIFSLLLWPFCVAAARICPPAECTTPKHTLRPAL